MEQLIREVVPAELASGRGLALGTFSSRQLSGVVTFTTPDVMVGHSWCSILAVDLAYRHRGLVRVLKEAAMDAAYALGARAMTSLVHPENQAMLHVNSTYGNVKRLANDVRYEAAGSDVMYSCMIKLPWERLR